MRGQGRGAGDGRWHVGRPQESGVGTTEPAWPSFKRDLWASVEAIGAAPWLVVVTIGLSVASYFAERFVWVGLPLGIFGVGFLGTQRVWFERALHGEQLSWREVASTTKSLVRPFFVLALLVGLVLTPFVLLARTAHGHVDAIGAIQLLAAGFVLDVGLTFVVPTLALTTRSLREALRIGLSMIKNTWPTSAWYIFVPVLTIGILANATEVGSFRPDVALHIVIIASIAILGLLFKGAIVAFYLRQPAIDAGSSGDAPV
jgi:hypothetical protein